MFRLSTPRRQVARSSVRQPGSHRIIPPSYGHQPTGLKRVHLLRAAGSNNNNHGGSLSQEQEKEQQQGIGSTQVDQTQVLLQAQQQQLADMQKQMLAMQQIMISQQQQNQQLMETMAQMAATKQAQGAAVPSSPERTADSSPASAAPTPAPNTTPAPTQPQAADASASSTTALPMSPPPQPTKDTGETGLVDPLPPPPPLLRAPLASSPPPVPPPPPPPASSKRKATSPAPSLRKIPVSPPPSIFKPPTPPQQAPQTPAGQPPTLPTPAAPASAGAGSATPEPQATGSAAAAGSVALTGSAAVTGTVAPGSAATPGAAAPGPRAPGLAAEPEPAPALEAAGTMVEAAASPPAAAPSAPTPHPESPPPPQPPPVHPQQPAAPPAAATAEKPTAQKMGPAESAAAAEAVAASKLIPASPPAPTPMLTPAIGQDVPVPTRDKAAPASGQGVPAPTTLRSQASAAPEPSSTPPPPPTPPSSCPVAQVASQLRRAADSRSMRSPKGVRSESTQLPSPADLNQMVASVVPALDAAPSSSIVVLLKQLGALSRTSEAGPLLTPTHLAELVRSLARRIDAIYPSAALTMSTPAISASARATDEEDGPSASSGSRSGRSAEALLKDGTNRANEYTSDTSAEALAEQAPQLLEALAQLVPASMWPQPISVRVLDPLHKWTYLDVAARLLGCVQASHLSGALAALRAAAAIHQQHTQTSASTGAVPNRPPTPTQPATRAPLQQPQQQQQSQGLGALEASANALVRCLFGAGANTGGTDVDGPDVAPGMAEALQQRNAGRLADSLLACMTLRVPPRNLQPLLIVLVLRLDELDADRLADVGKALLGLESFGSLDGPGRSDGLDSSSSGSNSGSGAGDPSRKAGSGAGAGVLAAWPQHFERASTSLLQLDSSSSSSNGRRGSATDSGGKRQKEHAAQGRPAVAYGLNTVAALAHVVACAGRVPGDAWLAAFDRRLRAVLGLLPGQPAALAAEPAAAVAGGGAVGSMSTSVAASVSGAGLAQLCSAAATFMIASPAFEKLRGSCARRLQSLLEAKISDAGRPSPGMSIASDGPPGEAGRVGMSAAELVDVLWGLDVMGQRPSDSQLNLLVIVGTAQLGSLSRTSLVRAVRVASRGTALNFKWWDSLQRTLLVALSSHSSMAGSSTLVEEQQQQQQQPGGAAVLSKHETLELLAACESAERLAAQPGMKAGPAAKASAKGTHSKAGGSAKSGSSSRGGGGGGAGATKGATSGVVALPLARVLLQSAHELACAGELHEAEEVARVVEGAASLEIVSSEGGLLSAQLLQQYEAATPVLPKMETGNAVAAAERSSNVAWVMAQSGHVPSESWRSAFLAKVTGVAPELMSFKGLLRALGAMHKLKACDTPVSPAWISSTITRIASPQAVRAASPLELVRACLALQYLDERQQEQQQQEGQRQQERQQQQEQPQPNAGGLWRGELRVGLLQEMVRKLQAGQAKALAMGDVVDVLQVCAYNRIEVGKPLGMELMRLLSQNAEAMPVESLISAANAASAIRLQGTPQQLEAMLDTMVHRTHAALTLTEQGAPSRPDPSSASTATSPLDASGDTELGVDAHSQLRTLLAVFATCKTYEFFPPPLQLAVFMARIEELLGSCQADILELESIIYGLLTFEIQPSDVLLERLAASLQTAPSCSPEKDAEILSDLIQLYLFGTPNNSSYMRLVGEGKRRLLQRLQAHAHNEQGGGESQQLQQKDVLVPSKTLLVIVPGLIELDKELSPLVELCLEELAVNCKTAIALEVQAQRSGQPAVKTGVLLHPFMLKGVSGLLYKVMGVSELGQASKQTLDPKGDQTDSSQQLQPAVLKCREIMKLVEEWALLKLPLLSANQMMELCFCFSFVGMAPSPELTQLVQPHIMSGLQNADSKKAFELMVFFYNQVLNKSSGDAAGTAAAAVGQPEASNSSSSSSSRKGPQPTRTSSKKSVQDGARDVCCAALKRVMALKTVTDEGEVLDLRTDSPSASARIMPGMSVAELILCLDYMKELGVGPFSSQWQDALQKTVAALVLEQEMPPEIMNHLVCATMAIMPPGHTYSSWWSAIVHLACAQQLVNEVPQEVESTIAPYILGTTQEQQTSEYSQQELQAEILETEKLLAAREQQGGLSRKELREVQEVRAQIARAKQELQQQQQQQQQRQDGTMYGIPVAPQSETLPPYSEAVRGLDDMLGSLTSFSTNPPAQPTPSTRPSDMTIDVAPQGQGTTQSNSSPFPDAGTPAANADAIMGGAEPQLALPPSKAVPLLSLCMALPHPPRQEWMQMLWAAVMPSLRGTAMAGGAAQEGSLAWFDARQHWDLHALGMLGMLSMRAGFDPGRGALEMLAQAAAPQLLPSGVALQTAIAILQVLTRFRCHPGDAWLHRFVASTHPVLQMLMPASTGSEGPGSADTLASAALASALTCLADLNWPPPLDWLALYYTVLYKGGHVQCLSHGLLWSVSTSLAKIISLQAQQQQQQQSFSAGAGQVPVPRQLVDLLAEEITARCTGDAARGGAGGKQEVGPDDAERLSQALRILRKI